MSAKGLNEFSVLNFQHSSPHQGGSTFVIRLIMNLDERKGKKTFTKLGLLRIKNLNQKLGIYWRLRFEIMWLKNVFKTTGNVTLRLENLVIYIIIIFVSDFIYQGTTILVKVFGTTSGCLIRISTVSPDPAYMAWWRAVEPDLDLTEESAP